MWLLNTCTEFTAFTIKPPSPPRLKIFSVSHSQPFLSCKLPHLVWPSTKTKSSLQSALSLCCHWGRCLWISLAEVSKKRLRLAERGPCTVWPRVIRYTDSVALKWQPPALWKTQKQGVKMAAAPSCSSSLPAHAGTYCLWHLSEYIQYLLTASSSKNLSKPSPQTIHCWQTMLLRNEFHRFNNTLRRSTSFYLRYLESPTIWP